MTDRADPCWAAAAGLSPAVRAALSTDPPPPAVPLAALLSAELPPGVLATAPVADLSPREQHALAAAAGPDLCLIDCPPGTDRPGFAAAAVAEAVRRGERVAVVTESDADADAVLARLLDADLVVGRAVGPGELSDPDHGTAAHTHEADILRRRLADGLDRRRADHAAAQAAVAALPRLTELADELTRLTRDVDAVKLDPLSQPDPTRDAELAALDATAQHKPTAKPGGLLGAVKGWFAKSEHTPADGARQQVIAAAADRRLADLLHQQADALDRFRAAGRVVAAAGLATPTPAGLAPVAVAVGKAETDAADAVAAAEGLLAQFDADRPGVERALCRTVPVAVGPAAALADPLLAAADRVIVLSADTLDDAALDRATAVAGRRVLLGTADTPARPHRNGKSGAFARPTLFRRLWDRLAPPDVWSQDGVQLVATLRPHEPADVSDEPLADRPEVELRFTPTGDLAAVVFPPTMTLADAKSLLAAELGFVALAGCGGHVWHDDPDRLAACWPAVDPDAGDWADLGDGVRELVCGCGPDGLTASVSFDRSSGWSREAAERWLAERLPTGRAVRLPAPVLVAG